MRKRQVGVMVLLFAQLILETVFLGELDKHREQEKLQDLRDDLRVHRDGIDALMNVNEALDDPLPFICCDGFRERRRVRLKVF